MDDRFFVVARESGQLESDLPTWADARPGNISFDLRHTGTKREDIEYLDGAFILHHVLNDHECDQFSDISKKMGYHLDAPVSLPHSVRHNSNVNWIVHSDIVETIWNRCSPLIHDRVGTNVAAGLNSRFRFYQYGPGDFFKPHTDGAWPGSKIVDNQLVHDAFGDRLSQMSFLLFLSDNYTGGRTLFFTGPSFKEVVCVATPKGAALCFPHGFHPKQYLHAGETIESGTKMIIRSDILFTMHN